MIKNNIIPNGYNMSLDEYYFHLHGITPSFNNSFTNSQVEIDSTPISTASFLSNPEYFLNNGKVFYVIALNKNIIEYRDLFYQGMNCWLNAIDQQLTTHIKNNNITLVLEALIEDLDFIELDKFITALSIQGIKNLQIWTCYPAPDSWYQRYRKFNIKKHIIDIPYHEKITVNFFKQDNLQFPKDKKYIYLCRRITDERVGFFNFLVQSELLDQGFVSMPNFDSLTGQPIMKWLDHPNRALDKASVKSMKQYFLDNPSSLTLDTTVCTDLDRLTSQQQYMGFSQPPDLESYYARSYVSLIAEGSLLPHQWMITEKTYRAILYKHMFFLLGSQYMLESLRQRGYKTFHKFWSEDYDKEANDTIRYKKALTEFNRILSTDLESLHSEVLPILEHNYNVLIERTKQRIEL